VPGATGRQDAADQQSRTKLAKPHFSNNIINFLHLSEYAWISQIIGSPKGAVLELPGLHISGLRFCASRCTAAISFMHFFADVSMNERLCCRACLNAESLLAREIALVPDEEENDVRRSTRGFARASDLARNEEARATPETRRTPSACRKYAGEIN
jgi:hypothetical protein